MYFNIRMSFLLFDMEFFEKVFKFHLVPFCSFFSVHSLQAGLLKN